jgi:hypothetical protein
MRLFGFGITLRDRAHLHILHEAVRAIPTGQRERFLRFVADVLRPRVHRELTAADIEEAIQEARRRVSPARPGTPPTEHGSGQETSGPEEGVSQKSTLWPDCNPLDTTLTCMQDQTWTIAQ